MMSKKVFSLLAAATICLLLSSGCAPPPAEPVVTKVEPKEPTITVVEPKEPTITVVEPKEPTIPTPPEEVPKPPAAEPVTLALKFTAQDSTTYRVITEGKRNVSFEGTLSADRTLKGGETGDRAELVFTQQIQGVNEKGNGIAKVTIKELKYMAKIKDNTVVDFDSSRQKDGNNPLAKLIGQSYTIEIGPAGQVAAVIDAAEARAAVKGRTSAERRASALLKADAVKDRHSVSALPAAGKNQLRTGDDWSSIKTFDFGLMGAKSYERIFLLKDVGQENGRQVASVEMNAIPTSAGAEQLNQEQPTNAFSKMFDNIDSYTGRLKLDLKAGKIERYVEELRSEWIILDPAATQKTDAEPDALKMTATQFHSIEKID
jgi:hypothetical protein